MYWSFTHFYVGDFVGLKGIFEGIKVGMTEERFDRIGILLGEDVGRTDGFNDGINVGFSGNFVGENDGVVEGRFEGNLGILVGEEVNRIDGFIVGFIVGANLIALDGINDGNIEGRIDCTKVGVLVCKFVGDNDGITVVGFNEGIEDGTIVVGLLVGFDEGSEVGFRLGDLETNIVGWDELWVGLIVGEVDWQKFKS